MCGRFVAASPPDEVARYFDAAAPEQLSSGAARPNFNVAPTQDITVVRTHEGTRVLDALHWGLVPFWAKDPKIGSRMINARAETVADKNAYRNAFRRRRCLIPADGFYEWDKVGGAKPKQPYFVHRPDDEPYAFAGLWERWRPESGSDEELRSVTIITTRANETMGVIHDRMPVILPASAWERWLDADVEEPEVLRALLVPAPEELVTMHAVTTEVGNPTNQGPHLVEPVEPGRPR